MMTGATAVAVGTVNLHEPQTALQIIAGLREFMQWRSLPDMREVVGSVQTHGRQVAELPPRVPVTSD